MPRQRITQANSGLDHKDWQLLKSLNNPAKIQDFINTLKFDFRDGHLIDRSVKAILKSRKADCAGGAMLAAAALALQGRRPLLLDLKVSEPDFDHLLAIFKEGKFYGAVSKTNHAVLRYREPVYASVRELVMSYFHEYFLPNGNKTLRSFSHHYDISKYGTSWFIDQDAVVDIIYDLDHSPHTKILNKKQIKRLRKAEKIEIKAGEIVQYK